MFDRFSLAARETMKSARLLALRLGHDVIATEHVLHALLDDAHDVPARAVLALGSDAAALRAAIVDALPARDPITDRSQLPFTPGMIPLLEGALEESRRLGSEGIGTEHLFLGTIGALGAAPRRVVARKVLEEHGLELADLHATTLRLLAPDPPGGSDSDT